MLFATVSACQGRPAVHSSVGDSSLTQYRAWMVEARKRYPYRQSVDRMYRVMLCESGGRAEVRGRFHGLFQYKRETWRGPWNPYRRENILDPKAQIFATAKAWKDGNADWWGCY